MFGFFRRKRPSRDWLDDVLFKWPTGDAFTVRDCMRSIEVKGITGSGKSSGSRDTLVRAILKHPKSTLFVIGQKPEDRTDFVAMFEEAKKPYVIMEEGSRWKCDFIGDELRAGADDRALVEFFVNQGEALQAGTENTGDNAKYFRMLEDRILYNTFVVLRLGSGGVDAEGVRDFIATAAYRNDDLTDEKWRAKFHNQTMHKAYDAPKSPRDARDFNNAMAFFTNEFVHLDEKPKSGAISGIMNTAHVFCTGLAHETCSNGTTVSPSVIDEGRSLFVNYPFANYGPTGRFIAGGMKYKVQKHILRRQSKPGDYFNVMVLDEFQESVTEMDARYLAMCRSHYGAMFCLTQTVHSEYSRMGGGNASHHKVGALTSNFGHHIAHTVDAATAKNFSEMLGARRETFVNLNQGEPTSAFDEIMGRSQYKASFSESYQPILQSTAFLSGLRTGGPSNDFKVDGIVIRSGEPFKNGENWQRVAFDQR